MTTIGFQVNLINLVFVFNTTKTDDYNKSTKSEVDPVIGWISTSICHHNIWGLPLASMTIDS